jgi:hypothetical protein
MMSFAQVAKRQASQGLRQQVLSQRGEFAHVLKSLAQR